MITTLTLNPCIDRTLSIKQFDYAGTNRVLSTREDISGKGINVSLVLKQLGVDTCCIGFNYKEGKDKVESFLNQAQIPYHFVEVEGELRTNVKVFNTQDEAMTEFNAKGGYVTDEGVQELIKLVKNYLKYTSLLVINGSVPLGVPTQIYRYFIEEAHLMGIKTILDAEGELLLEGIKAKPYLIKPNLEELRRTFGEEVSTKQDILALCREVIKEGVELVCVSMGSEGAMLVSDQYAYFTKGLEVDIKGLQGAGDSLVAGMCIALSRNESLESMLKYGVATALGSITREGTLLCREEDFKSNFSKIVVEQMG